VAASIDRVVLDCSVSLAWYLEDEQSAFADSLLQGLVDTETWVPALWRIEFSNALLVAERRRRITGERRLEILHQASLLPLQVDAHIHSLAALSALATQWRLSAYDAVYFELAQRRGVTLATLDKSLVGAARDAGLSFLTDID
jgi:predicted nucleic acid-binding protein